MKYLTQIKIEKPNELKYFLTIILGVEKSISSYSADGEIHDVHASFLYQYLETTEPMNVVISCGTNNIASGDSAWSIIFQVNC